MQNFRQTGGLKLFLVRVISILFFISIPLYITSCVYLSNTTNARFDSVAIGLRRVDVLQILGVPNVVDNNATGFFRYASQKCTVPCTERFWYENRLAFDIEAWSIELDKNGRVINKAHWVSP